MYADTCFDFLTFMTIMIMSDFEFMTAACPTMRDFQMSVFYQQYINLMAFSRNVRVACPSVPLH